MSKPTRMIECPDSSNIHSFGYMLESKELHVIFKHGGHYVFFDVPRTRFISMINADSRGSYFSKNIKQKFSSDIIEK